MGIGRCHNVGWRLYTSTRGERYFDPEPCQSHRDCFDLEEFIDTYTDYFNPFDYIVGDYSYDKLRLKGFYKSDNKNVSDCSDIKRLNDYIDNYCAYGAKYFLLKKIK